MTMQVLNPMPFLGVNMAAEEPLTKFEAGQIIRARREALGYTQTEVVENTTITVETYVSELENGKVNVGRSKHFPSLARFLKLSEDEIRSISPSAVFSLPDDPVSTAGRGLSSPSGLASRALSAASKYGNVPIRRKIEIPDALREAAEQYGHLPMYKGIGERRWQHFMLGVSRKAMPQDVEGWLREFSELKRMDYDPEEPE